MCMEYIFGCRHTEGGHCQGACRPQWLVYAHSKSVRELHHLHGHARHETCTVSNVEGQESFHKFTRAGIKPPTADLAEERLYPPGYCATSVLTIWAASTLQGWGFHDIRIWMEVIFSRFTQ